MKKYYIVIRNLEVILYIFLKYIFYKKHKYQKSIELPIEFRCYILFNIYTVYIYIVIILLNKKRNKVKKDCWERERKVRISPRRDIDMVSTPKPPKTPLNRSTPLSPNGNLLSWYFRCGRFIQPAVETNISLGLNFDVHTRYFIRIRKH